MKKLLLMITLLAAMPTALMAQKKLKALYCDELKTLYFVYNTTDYTTGSYSGQIPELSGHNIDAIYYGTLSNECPDWRWESDNVETVYFTGSFSEYRPTTTKNWFHGFEKLTTIKGLYNLITINVTDMSWMFYDCKSLTSLDLSQKVSNFKTDNVTDMSGMFCYCTNLTSLNLKDFDTSNVTTTESMFEECSSLTSLNLGNMFKNNTGNATNMARMFDGCNSLASLDVSEWNTSKVKNMLRMFKNCKNLTSLNVSNWDTSNVTEMQEMFYFCEKITSLDVSKWNTSKVMNMYRMFYACPNLTSLDVSKWDTSNVTDMSYLFSNCDNLTSLDVSKWNTSKVTAMYGTFNECYSLTTLDVSKWDTSNVTDMTRTFRWCEKLTSLDVSGWDMSNVTGMMEMFSSCHELKSLTFGTKFYKRTTTNADDMFYGTTEKLRYINFAESNYSVNNNNIDKVVRGGTIYDETEDKYKKNTNMFAGVDATTVIYLPTNSPAPSGELQNVVYTKFNGKFVCEDYYSDDKVDIELPYQFKANKAEYYREMPKTKYGTVILPYPFTSNDDIQGYYLAQEHRNTMYFEPGETFPCHYPFLFEKKNSDRTARFITEDKSGKYGIIVDVTDDTEVCGPYKIEGKINCQETVASEVKDQKSWSMEGYYVKQTVNNESGYAYYIAGDKFYKANKALTLYPHRVRFKGEWYWTGGTDELAPFLNIGILGADGEEKELTDIESAELFNTVNGISAIYDLQGRRLQQMQLGLNIVHMEDGRILKVKK